MSIDAAEKQLIIAFKNDTERDFKNINAFKNDTLETEPKVFGYNYKTSRVDIKWKNLTLEPSTFWFANKTLAKNCF